MPLRPLNLAEDSPQRLIRGSEHTKKPREYASTREAITAKRQTRIPGDDLPNSNPPHRPKQTPPFWDELTGAERETWQTLTDEERGTLSEFYEADPNIYPLKIALANKRTSAEPEAPTRLWIQQVNYFQDKRHLLPWLRCPFFQVNEAPKGASAIVDSPSLLE